jgi:hypothetical protein
LDAVVGGAGAGLGAADVAVGAACANEATRTPNEAKPVTRERAIGTTHSIALKSGGVSRGAVLSDEGPIS